mgnify:FL=1|jgi:hypothetical protein
MGKFQNLNIVQLKSRSYNQSMIKKILIVLFLVFSPITACSSLSELNERVKGDGVPYIPGI